MPGGVAAPLSYAVTLYCSHIRRACQPISFLETHGGKWQKTGRGDHRGFSSAFPSTSAMEYDGENAPLPFIL